MAEDNNSTQLSGPQRRAVANEPGVRLQRNRTEQSSRISRAAGRLFGGSRDLLRRVGTFAGTNSKGAQNEREQRNVRKAFSQIASQGNLTIQILQKNGKELQELAKENSQVAGLLDQIDDNSVSQLTDISSKLEQGEEISPEEARFFTDQFKSLTETLDDVGVKLSVDLRDVSKQTGQLIQNDNLSLEDRRKILDQTVAQLGVAQSNNQLSQQQNEKLTRLQQISKDQTNISGDLLSETSLLLSDIGDDATEIKTEQTLKELNDNLDSFVLTQDKLSDTLNKQTDDGKSFEEIFEQGLGSQLGQGLLGFGLSTIGLGGLEQLIPTDFLSTVLATRLGVGGRALGSAGGGLLGRAAGAVGLGGAGAAGTAAGGAAAARGGSLLGRAGRFLGGGARVLSKIALPLAAIASAFEFAEGFANAAEIAGLEPGQEADFGTKIQAGISSVLSGLTLGFVESEDIFKTIEEGIDKLFGDDGLFPNASGFLERILQLSPIGMIGSVLNKVTGGTGELFGKDGLFARASTFLSTIASKVAAFFGITEEFEAAVDALFGKEGVFNQTKDFLQNVTSKLKNFFGFDEEATPAEVGAEPPTQEQILKQVAEQQSGLVSEDGQPAVIQEPVQMETAGTDSAAAEAISQAEAREVMRQAAERQDQGQQIIPLPVEQSQQTKAPTKTTQVDDMGLLLTGSLLFE